MWLVILALIAAVVIILVVNALRGGASEISRTEFRTLVENSQYVTKEGKLKSGYSVNENGVIVDGNGLAVEDLAKYAVNGDGVVVLVNSDGSLSSERLGVIWRISTDAYEYNGYTVNANGEYVRSYYCYGPSPYGAESWDSQTFIGWESNGVTIIQQNPNSGSWVSTALTIGSLVIV